LGLFEGELYSVVYNGYEEILKLQKSSNLTNANKLAEDIINTFVADSEDYGKLSKIGKNDTIKTLYDLMTGKILSAINDEDGLTA
jgi:hypothetical protein